MSHCNVEQRCQEFFRKMKNAEETFVTILEKPDKQEDKIILFEKYLQDQKILANKYELKSFLYLIVAISNHFHRSENFFPIISLLIQRLNTKIRNYFSSFEVFHIFKSSKRLLLFLFKMDIITPTEEIYFNIISNKKYIERKYLDYFSPEFESFMDDEILKSIQQMNKSKIEEFKQKRENGVNDNYICKLIQNDNIVDFENHLTKTNTSPSSTIPPSIYETNSFLLNKSPTLIEYSAFCGSIQIFKYLHRLNCTLKPSIWTYAIHGRNAEIIHFLKEQKIKTLYNSIQYLCLESIKCHHNELIPYFLGNICSKKDKIYKNLWLRKSLKYYNFAYFSDKIIDNLFKQIKENHQMNILYYLCKYDYYSLVEFLCKSNFIDINYEYTIYKPIFENCDNIFEFMALKSCVENYKEVEKKVLELKDLILRYHIEESRFFEYKYNVENSTILCIAVRKGNMDIIQLLLSFQTIKLNTKSTKIHKKKIEWIDLTQYFIITEEKSILNEAVDSGYLEVVQYLFRNNSINANDATVIKTKIYQDYNSPEPDYYEGKFEKALLHHAIQKGNINVIKLLITDLNIDVNAISTSNIKEALGGYVYTHRERTIKKSALFYAIKYTNAKIVKLLLEKQNNDINFGICDEFLNNEKILEKSPLYMAVENENLKMVQLLLKHPKINVNFESIFMNRPINKYMDYKKEIKKKTIFQMAVEKENIKIIQLLLEQNGIKLSSELYLTKNAQILQLLKQYQKA